MGSEKASTANERVLLQILEAAPAVARQELGLSSVAGSAKEPRSMWLATEPTGAFPIHEAAAASSITLVEKLLLLHPEALHIRDAANKLPLHCVLSVLKESSGYSGSLLMRRPVS